jgi:phage terminase large subunit-like protein
MARAKKAPISLDPATRYAEDVLGGKLIAGPSIRASCQRHINDLKEGHKRGLQWDSETVDRVVGFARDVLRLNGGEYEGKPYELLPWQSFIVGNLFGWKGADGFRRFRVCYVETAKGSGKSPLAALVGLYGLVADGEARAEIYAAAVKRDQAMILFRDAIAMRDQSPALRERLVKSGIGENAWNLAYHKTGSFFRPIASDDGQSGPRPHVALLDEIHEHRNGQVIEMLRAGTKSRRQAIVFMITNSGSNRQSVCYQYHDYGKKVSSGLLQDDSFFSFVSSLDEDDDPFADEECWYKANPSLQYGLPGLKYIREQVAQAKGMPSKEAIVRRLNFCQWTDAENPWISADAWNAAKDTDFDESLLRNRMCYGGLDLSSTLDLTAFALVFMPTAEDNNIRIKAWFWLPGDNLQEKVDKDRVPYDVWRQHGYIETISGRAVNKTLVARRIAEICSQYEVANIGFDMWRIEDFKMILNDEGISLPMVPFGQGYKSMSPAVDEFERALVDGYLKHDGNPVMTWCASNAITTHDPAGNRKCDKAKAIGRIDGVIAALMAIGESIKRNVVDVESWIC